MEGMLTPAIMWAILGAIFFVVELSTFTFIFSFFGIGAFVDGHLDVARRNHDDKFAVGGV